MSDLHWAASDLEVAFTTSVLTAAEGKANDYGEPVAVLLRDNKPQYELVSRLPETMLSSECVEVVHPRWSAKHFCATCGRMT